MGMELISMEHWQEFFTETTELKRAKLQHLEDVIKILPWIATVDKFQHWIYTHANHTSCLLYTSPSPRDRTRSRMPSSA